MHGSFPFDGENLLSGGPVLQGELADDPTETGHLDVSDGGGGLTQEQQEGVEPGSRGPEGSGVVRGPCGPSEWSGDHVTC